MVLRSRFFAPLLALLVACGGPSVAPQGPLTSSETAQRESASVAPQEAAEATPAQTTISVVGTNDVHGQVERLAVLSGYLKNLRAVRANDGAVLLVDGGDMWQGTLASNLGEGKAVLDAYNALGYDAATIGNHEFDYGPVGPRATPAGPDDDPRGALKARAAEAQFPLLTANIIEGRLPLRATNVAPTTMIEKAGVKIGLIGVSTMSTPSTTISANVRDLKMAPLPETIVAHATALRAEGANAVVVLAHAGGKCHNFDNPQDLSSCDEDEEIFEAAKQIPAGIVNLIVAGHTHAGVAHEVNGTPIIESYANGLAFGRVDLKFVGGELTETNIYPPQAVCEQGAKQGPGIEGCTPTDYEGQPVTIDQALLEASAAFREQANTKRAESLGVDVAKPLTRDYRDESSLGNFLASRMLAAKRDHDFALLNAGGVRANIPAGPLTYGALYEAFPFDNLFATIELTTEEFTELIAKNLKTSGGTYIIAGGLLKAECKAGELDVTLMTERRRKIPAKKTLRVITSDYIATQDNAVFQKAREEGRVTIHDADGPMRDVIAAQMAEMKRPVIPMSFLRPSQPRMSLPSMRPIRCR